MALVGLAAASNLIVFQINQTGGMLFLGVNAGVQPVKEAIEELSDDNSKLKKNPKVMFSDIGDPLPF